MMSAPQPHHRDPVLRWFLPELRYCRTKEESREALKSASIFGGAIELGVFLVTMFAAAAVVPMLVLRFRPAWMPVGVMGPIMAVLVIAGIIAQGLWGRERRRRCVRRFLVARGMRLCLHCSYDLSASIDEAEVSARCPECGEELTSIPK